MALITITTASMRMLPFGLLSQSLPMLTRHELEDVVERLIDELDRRDGDLEREPEEDYCTAGDDGCGPIRSHGHVHWGSEWDEQGVVTPRYGLDQSLGPTAASRDLVASGLCERRARKSAGALAAHIANEEN